MKHIAKALFILSGLTAITCLAYADPATFLGPSIRGSYTQSLTDNSAYSLLGEAGLKNFRIGGTVGWKIDPKQLFKVSLEYLWEDITFSFLTGNADQWVNQGAIGAAYQYDFLDYAYNPRADLGVYASHAPSQSLGTTVGNLSIGGVPIPFAEARRVAGSSGEGASAGLTISPWWGNNMGVAVNYDNINYDTFYGNNEDARGFGGTAHFNQLLTQDISIGGSASIRQPFNYYTANIDYSNWHWYGDWTFGLFGDYTVGKTALSNTYDAGINVNYYLDRRCSYVPANLKGEFNLKSEVPAMQPVSDNLLAWTADPAVYMPRVLTITDKHHGCAGILNLIRPFNPDVTIFTTGIPLTFIIPGGAHFTDIPGRTFSLITSQTLPANNTIAINPTTGVITANFPRTPGITGTLTVTVVATAACGSVQSNTFVFHVVP